MARSMSASSTGPCATSRRPARCDPPNDAVGGPRRRAYELTDAGYRALDQWAEVMRERARLIAEFNADYLDAVTAERSQSVGSAAGQRGAAGETLGG